MKKLHIDRTFDKCPLKKVLCVMCHILVGYSPNLLRSLLTPASYPLCHILVGYSPNLLRSLLPPASYPLCHILVGYSPNLLRSLLPPASYPPSGQ